MPSLRFVEVNGDKQNIVVLKNLPSQIIGHQGEIKPKISNGHISRNHCTVIYQSDTKSWLVVDGDPLTGVESRNGLLTANGQKVIDKLTLTDPGDRVYLLFLHNTSAYLEVFNTEEEKTFITSGISDCDVDHQLAKMHVNSTLLKSEVSAISNIVIGNKDRIESTNAKIENTQAKIDQVEIRQRDQASKLDSLFSLLEDGLNHVEDVGTKPKVFVIGFLIVISASLMSLGLYGVYRNLDPIINNIFKIEQKRLKN